MSQYSVGPCPFIEEEKSMINAMLRLKDSLYAAPDISCAFK